MTRETVRATTFACDACRTSQTIGGEQPEVEMEKQGWALEETILTKIVDLCPKCVDELRTLINGKKINGYEVGSYDRDSGVMGVGMDLSEGGTR